jgi:hypothetical protein
MSASYAKQYTNISTKYTDLLIALAEYHMLFTDTYFNYHTINNSNTNTNNINNNNNANNNNMNNTNNVNIISMYSSNNKLK